MVVATAASSILAHQGGWDEILLVAAPVAVIAGLLAVAKRRVDRAESAGVDPLDAGADGS
jgi:hypothetical protein